MRAPAKDRAREQSRRRKRRRRRRKAVVGRWSSVVGFNRWRLSTSDLYRIIQVRFWWLFVSGDLPTTDDRGPTTKDDFMAKPAAAGGAAAPEKKGKKKTFK